jgi:uncharacterized protein
MVDARQAAARQFRGRALLSGQASGTALVLDEPLSFWGGLDPETGLIIEDRHSQRGQSVAGRVVVMAAGRGSSSSSNVLAEALRLGTGPAAILLIEADEIVLVGALVVELLDGVTMPIVVLGREDHGQLRTGDAIAVDDRGTVRVSR